jgi:hypothetical protein
MAGREPLSKRRNAPPPRSRWGRISISDVGGQTFSYAPVSRTRSTWTRAHFPAAVPARLSSVRFVYPTSAPRTTPDNVSPLNSAAAFAASHSGSGIRKLRFGVAGLFGTAWPVRRHDRAASSQGRPCRSRRTRHPGSQRFFLKRRRSARICRSALPMACSRVA